MIGLNERLYRMFRDFREANNFYCPNTLRCGKNEYLQLLADVECSRVFKTTPEGIEFNGMRIFLDDKFSGYKMERV